jgi:hypothetical protein
MAALKEMKTKKTEKRMKMMKITTTTTAKRKYYALKGIVFCAIFGA